MAASSGEAEYYAYSSAVKDLQYVRLLLCDLRIFPDDASPPTMLVDSEPAIAMSGPTHCSRTKHIDFTQALVRDYVQPELALLEHCSTDEQIADMWTKQLGLGRLQGSFHGSCSFLVFLVWCCVVFNCVLSLTH